MPMSGKRKRRYGLTGLPRVRNLEDLSAHTGLPAQQLWRLIYKDARAYVSFSIPKKAGGQRRIDSPTPFLRCAQKWILQNILNHLRSEQSCYGFEPGSKLRTHAEQHRYAKAILTLDLEEFFPSISIARVVQVFKVAGYLSTGAWLLARLCTRQGRLPQGAPTSPKLANLVCYRLDRRLAEFAESMGLVYTRYADDLSFSGEVMAKLAKLRPFVTHIVKDCGFRLNHKKTRLVGPSGAKIVTGLVIGHDEVGIGRRRLRELRATIHRAHVERDRNVLASIQGWLDFVSDADPTRYKMIVTYIRRLTSAASPSCGNTVVSELRCRAS
jgi:RNA-directed DNA polymerase